MSGITMRATVPGIGWMAVASLWLVTAMVPSGYTLWLGFAAIAVIGRRVSWGVTAAVYGAVALLLHGVPSGPWVVVFLTALTVVGLIHALVVNPSWLRLLWERRMAGVPFYRPVGHRTQRAPAVSREGEELLEAAGARPSDFFEGSAPGRVSPYGPTEASPAPQEAAPAEMVDVNTASARELSGLPGVSRQAAGAAVKARKASGGFRSVDAFSEAAGLQPHQFLAVRAAATCSRPARVRNGFGRRVDY